MSVEVKNNFSFLYHFKNATHCLPKNLIGMCVVKCSQPVISSSKYIRTLKINVLQINPIFISKEIMWLNNATIKGKYFLLLCTLIHSYGGAWWRHSAALVTRKSCWERYCAGTIDFHLYTIWCLRATVVCLYLHSCWICKSWPLFYSLFHSEISRVADG